MLHSREQTLFVVLTREAIRFIPNRGTCPTGVPVLSRHPTPLLPPVSPHEQCKFTLEEQDMPGAEFSLSLPVKQGN